MSAKSPSKMMLVIGLVFLAFAAFGVSLVWSGVSHLKEIAKKVEANTDREKVHVDLSVPGTTTATLEPQAYSIWLQGDDVAAQGNDDLDASELPKVEWDISGPAPVTVRQNMQVRVNDYRLAGTFTIEQAGEYEFKATVPEGVELDCKYNIGDDPSAVFGEVLGTVAESAGSIFKIAIGGVGGAISAIIGIVLLIMFAARASKASSVSQM